MPKIQLLIDCTFGLEGQILEKPDAWVQHHARKLGTEFDLVLVSNRAGSAEETPIFKKDGTLSDSKESAFMQLSEGDKDSVRKGFKVLVLRKAGWVLRDCSNKASEEIHISIVNDRSGFIKDAKAGAIAKAKAEFDVLGKFKYILSKCVLDEYDFSVSFDEDEREDVLELVSKLSIGNSEVEVLKSEIEKLRKIGTKN